MLKLENVKKQYDGFQLDCSMEVKPGCITGLVGENGSGKSTTFTKSEWITIEWNWCSNRRRSCRNECGNSCI